MNSQLQRGGSQLNAQPDYPDMTEKGMSPWNELSIVIAVFLISLILDYGALFYFGNPIHLVIVFMAIMEAMIFSALIVHFLVVMIKGLRIEGEYFILPHPGLYALVKGGPRTIRFKDIDVAYYHQGQTGKKSQLRIKLTDGRGVSLCQGDLGIRPGSFEALIKEIQIKNKLDTTHFLS